MINTAGFYRFLNGELRCAPTAVYLPNAEPLLAAEKDSYVYPYHDWSWFDSITAAEAYYEINGASSADWQAWLSATLSSPEFGAAKLQASQTIIERLPIATDVERQRLLRAANALDSLPAAMVAAAASPHPIELFIGAWLSLRQAHLVSPAVASAMAQLAMACNLPSQLIAALGAPQQ